MERDPTGSPALGLGLRYPYGTVDATVRRDAWRPRVTPSLSPMPHRAFGVSLSVYENAESLSVGYAVAEDSKYALYAKIRRTPQCTDRTTVEITFRNSNSLLRHTDTYPQSFTLPLIIVRSDLAPSPPRLQAVRDSPCVRTPLAAGPRNTHQNGMSFATRKRDSRIRGVVSVKPREVSRCEFVTGAQDRALASDGDDPTSRASIDFGASMLALTI